MVIQMKIKTITASYTQKWGLPEYSNIEIHASMTAELQRGEDPAKAEEALIRRCMSIVNAEGERKLKEYWKGKQ